MELGTFLAVAGWAAVATLAAGHAPMSGRDWRILKHTVYLEARGESDRGQQAVVHVIKNRASANRGYWGGRRIGDVCLHPRQFACWNPGHDTSISEPRAYERVSRNVERAMGEGDFTHDSDHYNNPAKEGYPPWTRNCRRTLKIGAHQFYRSN